MDDTTIQSLVTIVVGAAVQVYNQRQHADAREKLRAAEARLTVTDEALLGDINEARAALERLTVRVNGGDRRAARPPLSKTEVDGARTEAQAGRRWKDLPNNGLPSALNP